MRERAQDVFENKVKIYSKKLVVKVKRIAIKNLRNRWGSLIKSGVINLNLNLIKAPEDIIDYIILHELCHLKIKEHSHHYKRCREAYNKLVKEWTEQIITEYSMKNGSSRLFMPEKGRQQQLFQKASNNLSLPLARSNNKNNPMKIMKRIFVRTEF